MYQKYISKVALFQPDFKPNFFGKVEPNRTTYVSNFTVVAVIQL